MMDDGGAWNGDGGGSPRSEKKEPVLPRRCSKLKLDTQEYSVEYCDHEGQIGVERDSPDRLKGYGAEAAGREDEEVVPAIRRTPRIRAGQNGGGVERGIQR